MCPFLVLIKLNMHLNLFHLGLNQVSGYQLEAMVIFFQSCTFFFKTKIGQLSVIGLSNEKQSIEPTNNCFT